MKEFVLRIRLSRSEEADLRNRARQDTGGNMSELVRRLLWPPQPEPKGRQHEQQAR